MANKSMRKRSMKSSNENPNSSQHNSMAPSASSLRSRSWIFPLLISAAVFVFVLIPFSSSVNKRHTIGANSNFDLIYSAEAVNEFPHDASAFTQGLSYGGNDTLFESTGLNGQSSVRRVVLTTGKVEAIHAMQYEYFGEGSTLLGNRLFQVTWRKKTGFIYDQETLNKINTFNNPMPDGWGLATDGHVLFGTDGSSTLYKIDPDTMKVVEKHIVKYNEHEVNNLNELEYINGEVWANVWLTDCIARLSAKDGAVLGWIYLPNLREGLTAAGYKGFDVLNGIAWDQEKSRIFVTGKLWPKLYEIKVQPMKKPLKGDIKDLCILPPFNFGKS